MSERGAATIRVMPGHEERLRRIGLDDPVAILGFEGGRLVNRHAKREVRCVEDGQDLLFVKRQANRTARREFEALRALAARGIAVAEPVAVVEGSRRSALVTLGVPGGRALEELWPELDRAGRRRVTRATADLVARLHASGFAFPDLFAKHVILGARGRPHLIDLERLEKRLTRRRRARDLAALALTCGFAGARATDMAAFLRAYLGAARLGPDARVLARDIRKAHVKLARRRRNRRHLLTVRDEHREALRSAGLRTFADFLEHPEIESVRRLPDRENVRVVAEGKTYFGKRVDVRHLAVVEREWRGLQAFRREGLPGPSPAAIGTDPVDGGFVYTAQVPGRPLDDLLREGRVPDAAQRRLARDLGALVRRMHGLGYWHRDLYLCHVFAEPIGDGFALSLIDLGRLGHKARPRKRWFVKDLAALWHSLPRETVRAATIGEFLRAYAGDAGRLRELRTLVRRVRRKARRMARHVPKWIPGKEDSRPAG